ncbi:MAG: methylated-DNA--[protein]-cysteine S-methyltransferase [Alphaproteobacteria bacterium]
MHTLSPLPSGTTEISYTFIPTPYGEALLLHIMGHICGLYFITQDHRKALAEAQKDYPIKMIENANISPELFSSTHQKLFVKGTPFQIKVWQALLTIRCGATQTYRDIAEEIGHPQSSRAVGNAIGRNPISLLIPCHRVIKKDGTLGGYRFGQNIKKRILEDELNGN